MMYGQHAQRHSPVLIQPQCQLNILSASAPIPEISLLRCTYKRWAMLYSKWRRDGPPAAVECLLSVEATQSTTLNQLPELLALFPSCTQTCPLGPKPPRYKRKSLAHNRKPRPNKYRQIELATDLPTARHA